MHSIMANLNLGQYVANKRERKLWPNLVPYSKLLECVVTVLLLTSTPLSSSICSSGKKLSLVFLYYTLKDDVNKRAVTTHSFSLP